LGVLAECGRRGAEGRATTVDADGIAYHFVRADLWMIDRSDHRAPAGSAQRLAHASHERRRHRGLSALRNPVRCSRAPEFALENANQLAPMVHAPGIRSESAVRCQIGAPKHARAQKLKMTIGP